MMTEIPFDESVVLQLTAGDRGRASRYIRAFAASLPGYREELVAALDENRFADLRDHAHQLAGAAAYCGARPLYATAKSLDKAVARGEPEELSALLRQTLDQIQRLLTLELDRFE